MPERVPLLRTESVVKHFPAGLGATVVLACRDRTRGESALAEVAAAATGAQPSLELAETIVCFWPSSMSWSRAAPAPTNRNRILGFVIRAAASRTFSSPCAIPCVPT